MDTNSDTEIDLYPIFYNSRAVVNLHGREVPGFIVRCDNDTDSGNENENGCDTVLYPNVATLKIGYINGQLVNQVAVLDEWGKSSVRAISRSRGPAVIYDNGNIKWYLGGRSGRLGGGPSAVFEDGTIEYYEDGMLHREGDAPSNISEMVTQWHYDGVLHREGDAPSEVYSSGSLSWNYKGEEHRVRGPYAIHVEGDVLFGVNGNMHRERGPAVIHRDGAVTYYNEGVMHRADGPALIPSEGAPDYFIHGVLVDPVAAFVIHGTV